MNKYLKNDKLIIPEEEIDNIYVWTRISNTQEALLSSLVLFKLIEHSFNEEAFRSSQVLKHNCTIINANEYKLADFITFIMNKDAIFVDNFCNVVSTDAKVLNSLACFIAHQKHLFFLRNESLSNMILELASNAENVKHIFESDFIYFDIQTSLPDYKYRGAILDMLLIKRSKQYMYTLTYTPNVEHVISNNAISKESANKYGLKNICDLTRAFNNRRKATYQQLLKDWFYLMQIDLNNFVYSKKKLEPQVRQISRYK